MQTKEILRKKIRKALSEISEDKRSRESHLICAQMYSLDVFTHAKHIAAYIPMRHEIDITPLLHEILKTQKKLSIPKCLPNFQMNFKQIHNLEEDLQSGAYGILEPKGYLLSADYDTIDLVIVPALAVDIHGYRLGHGGGYYDRFLKEHGHKMLKCTLIYEDMLLQDLPCEPHDACMDVILTQERIVHIQQSIIKEL